MSDPHTGYVQSLPTKDCKVFIPFMCKKCGNCCRKIGVQFGYFNPSFIASHLGLTPCDVVTKYLGEVISESKEEIQFKPTRPQTPCPFLSDNLCSIHDVRPGPCQVFPIATDFGDHGIGCPAKIEATKAMKALSGEVPYNVRPVSDEPLEGDKQPRIKMKAWKRIMKKYVRTNPSRETLDMFVAVNERFLV